MKPSGGSWGAVPSRNIIIPWPVYLAPLSSTYGVPTVCLPHNDIHAFSWRLAAGDWALTPSGNFHFSCFSPFGGSPYAAQVLTVSHKALQFSSHVYPIRQPHTHFLLFASELILTSGPLHWLPPSPGGLPQLSAQNSQLLSLALNVPLPRRGPPRRPLLRSHSPPVVICSQHLPPAESILIIVASCLLP